MWLAAVGANVGSIGWGAFSQVPAIAHHTVAAGQGYSLTVRGQAKQARFRRDFTLTMIMLTFGSWIPTNGIPFWSTQG